MNTDGGAANYEWSEFNEWGSVGRTNSLVHRTLGEGGSRAPIDSPWGTGYRMDMTEVPQVRVVRERPPETGGPAEYLRRAETLMAETDRLNPWPRPRGFVQRFRTREDYEAWKKQQANPRLW